MKDLSEKKVAIVCDWIKDWGGAEQVLSQLLKIFPNADIYTSVFFQKHNSLFDKNNVYTSFIQKIPFLNKRHKMSLFLRPLAFEGFDLRDYDIVISSSSAESKWVITKLSTLHVCYCHTPTRYFWSHYHDYKNMMEFWWLNGIAKFFMPKMTHSLRKWDYVAAQRPDYYIANSKNTAKRIHKYYWRDAEVIYPWIDVDSFEYSDEKEDYYLAVWRIIPYKKFDLLVDAFNKNWKNLIIVTSTDNNLSNTLRQKSESNVTWRMNVDNKQLRYLYARARGVVFPPEEDFWIVPLEAMASWTPVIVYNKWWAIETVIDKITWVFFEKHTVESLNKAINKFEKIEFDYQMISEHAMKFDNKIFAKKIMNYFKKKAK